MARTHVRYQTTLPAAEAFRIVTDWPRHRVPFTQISVTDIGFTARTGLGVLGFDDPMQITSWDPPNRVELRKLGRIIRGEATIEIEADGPGSVVTWTEDARVLGVPRWCDRVVARLLSAMISLVLRRLFA